jgi:hypothetical protein
MNPKSMTPFAMGTAVYVHGLQRRIDLNFKGARICMETARADGRFGIEMFGSKKRFWVRIPDESGLKSFPMNCGFAWPTYKWVKKHLLESAGQLCKCGRVTNRDYALCRTCHKSQWSKEARSEHADMYDKRRRYNAAERFNMGEEPWEERRWVCDPWSWNKLTMNIAPPGSLEADHMFREAEFHELNGCIR